MDTAKETQTVLLTDRSETEEYINNQIKYAEGTNDIFSQKAIDYIYDFSKGIARVIDKVCTSSLIYGFQYNRKIIDDHDIKMITDNEF